MESDFVIVLSSECNLIVVVLLDLAIHPQLKSNLENRSNGKIDLNLGF